LDAAVRRLERAKDSSGERAAGLVGALGAIVRADSGQAGKALDAAVKGLERATDSYECAAWFEALGVIVKADSGQAGKAFDVAVKGLERATASGERAAGLGALGAIVRADSGQAGKVLDVVVKGLERATDSYERAAGLRALGAIASADKEQAGKALDAAVTGLERATASFERAAWLGALGVIVRADSGQAGKALDAAVKGLERATDFRERAAGLDALGAIASADKERAGKALAVTLQEFEREAEKPLERQELSETFETTLTAILKADPKEALPKCFPKLTKYGVGKKLRPALRAALAAGVAALAKQDADPATFLFDHLEGRRQTLMLSSNPDMRDATTCADYRRVIERAIALHLTDETTPADVAARITKRLETMRKVETRLHLRVAAWDTLIAAHEIRESKKNETSAFDWSF
jgi:hypothetical protein